VSLKARQKMAWRECGCGEQIKLDLKIPVEQKGTILEVFLTFGRWFPDHYQELGNLIHTAKDKGLQICIEPLASTRTRSQESYYRKWARAFGNHTGNTPDEIHDILLGICYGTEIVKTKFGPRKRPLQRSGEQSKSTYSELIDTLIRIGAEMDFEVPPPRPPDYPA